MTGLTPEEAVLSAPTTARRLMAARPGAYVDVIRRHDGPGLCARIPHGAGHWTAIGAVGEVAEWVTENYQDPAAAVPRTATAGPAGEDGIPGSSPAGRAEAT